MKKTFTDLFRVQFVLEPSRSKPGATWLGVDDPVVRLQFPGGRWEELDLADVAGERGAVGSWVQGRLHLSRETVADLHAALGELLADGATPLDMPSDFDAYETMVLALSPGLSPRALSWQLVSTATDIAGMTGGSESVLGVSRGRAELQQKLGELLRLLTVFARRELDSSLAAVAAASLDQLKTLR